MIVYYVSINSPFFRNKKYFFACRCSVDKYVESEIENLQFLDKEAQKEFEELDKSTQKRKREQAFDIISINTKTVKKYKRMFPARFYREPLCA